MSEPSWWVIWSEEHGAWWGPNHGSYTRKLLRAGRYTKTEARGIERRADWKAGVFHEVALPDPLGNPPLTQDDPA